MHAAVDVEKAMGADGANEMVSSLPFTPITLVSSVHLFSSLCIWVAVLHIFTSAGMCRCIGTCSTLCRCRGRSRWERTVSGSAYSC